MRELLGGILQRSAYSTKKKQFWKETENKPCLFVCLFSVAILQLINCKNTMKKVIHTQSAKQPKLCHPSTWTLQFALYFLINQVIIPQGRRTVHEESRWQHLSAE